MSAVLAAMIHIELTFSNGMKQEIKAESLVFVKECDHCGRELRTPDLRKIRHNSCKRKAARLRQALGKNNSQPA